MVGNRNAAKEFQTYLHISISRGSCKFQRCTTVDR
jgi:hypothetical protein